MIRFDSRALPLLSALQIAYAFSASTREDWKSLRAKKSADAPATRLKVPPKRGQPR